MGKFNSMDHEVKTVKNEIDKYICDDIIKTPWNTIYIKDNNYLYESCVEAGIQYGRDNRFSQGYMRHTKDNLIEYCYTNIKTESDFDDYISKNPSLNYTLLYDDDVDFLALPYNYME